jgi:hydroxyacylglutathione hydrolase
MSGLGKVVSYYLIIRKRIENNFMKIKQFRYAFDNLGYVVYSQREAIAIDGGAVKQIQTFINDSGLILKYATNTHSHADHTMGTSELVKKMKATYKDHKILAKTGKIFLEDQEIKVLHTPGHTSDSVSFYTGSCLIAGDTLFNGTVGNCFSGELDQFLKSIKLLLSYPDDTILYAGHDYVKASIAVARQFEPFNPDLDCYMKDYDPDHVCSTLADERKVNPYLRFNQESIIAVLKGKGLPAETENQRWASVMTL